MSVRKPLEKLKDQIINIDALIDKGAKVKEDAKVDHEKKWTMINVRIMSVMLKEIDQAVSNRVGISRTGWILEAIHEKLKKGNE